MTSCPKPAIPDAPGLPPWVLAYAEYEGRCVRVVDRDIVAAACSCGVAPEKFSVGGRFAVGAGQPSVGDHAKSCPIAESGGIRLLLVLKTDDYGEALAVFAAHRDRLAEEGGWKTRGSLQHANSALVWNPRTIEEQGAGSL